MSPREDLLDRLRMAWFTNTTEKITGTEAREILWWWQLAVEATNLNHTSGAQRLPKTTL